MANEFIIKINKDSKGNNLSLENMPLEAVEALTIFLNSLKELGSMENNQNITFSLREGCVETSICYPESDELDKAIDGTSDDNEYTKWIKNIQNKILLNGLDYSLLLKKNNNPPVDITKSFKERKYSFKRKQRNWNQEIVFINGMLVDNGGKNVTNLHVDTGTEEIAIVSTRDEAKIINKFLFENVYVVAVKRYYDDEKPHYKFVDYYLHKDKFNYYKDFYNKLMIDDSLEKYDIIHNELVNIINGGNIGESLKIMRLFNFKFSNRGIIRTILMTLKNVDKTNHKALAEMYDLLSEKLRIGSTNNVI